MTVRCLLMVLGMAAPPRADEAAEALTARFLKKAPAGWKALREAERNVEGVLRIESWDHDARAEPVKGFNKVIDFRRKGDWISLETKSMRGLGGMGVIASNDQYTFRLGMFPGEDALTIKDLKFVPAAESLAEIQAGTYFWRALQARREFWNIPLEEMVSAPGFRIKAIGEVPVAGESGKLVRIDFSYDSPMRKVHWADAWMVLDPGESWAIRTAGYEQVVVTIDRPERDPGKGQFRYVRVLQDPERSFWQTYQFTFEQLDHRVLPDSDFRLSRHGFSEPVPPAKAPGAAIPPGAAAK